MGAIRSFIGWLGQGRANAIFVLLAVSGLFSLMLNVITPRPAWVAPVQSALAVGFLLGTVLIVLSRFANEVRGQFALMLLPAAVALAFGIIYPNLALLFVPLALGWLVMTFVVLRGRVRPQYQKAIKAMHRGNYPEAIQTMSELIGDEPQQSDHYRFRAELYRLAQQPKRARADYKKVTELAPDSGVGYNGLAEVYLQEGDYAAALPFAQRALEMEPNEWVPPYNLGMIEDRLALSSEVVTHLTTALANRIPDSRHRLLVYVWLHRAYERLGDSALATQTLEQLKREGGGLREWERIFENEAAAVLKGVLEADVQTAAQLIAAPTAALNKGDRTS